ncbi:MAG: hypothetical protein FJZ38_26115 [Candidatus Rokubacteria bacterium]|nr:hypothetical protein [Candidatus Rokubacteria bacterium]
MQVALVVLILLAALGRASADSAWAVIEPATVNPDANVWERFWHRWTYGSGWVVNHFFESADACRVVERRWQAEAIKIMENQTRELREIVRAGDMISSRCVPAEALRLFNVRPGSGFPQR